MPAGDHSGGLSILESGVPSHSVGLAVVPVGPRMFLAACGVAAIALTPSIPSLAATLALLLACAAALGLLIPLLLSWRSVAWVSMSLLVVYSWAYPGSTHYVWIFGVESFFAALLIVTRLLAFVTVLYVLLLATGPLAIVRWAGDVNEDLGIMVSLTLSVIPVMRREMDTTIQAQQARGMKMGGSLVSKMRAYLAVLIPVVVKSLVRAYNMAALMHVRGYGSDRRVKPVRRLTAAAVGCYVCGVVWVLVGAAARVVLT